VASGKYDKKDYERLFQIYAKAPKNGKGKPCIRHTARTGHVDRKTVERWRDMQGWDERLAKDERKAERNVDKEIISELSRRIGTYTSILNAGLNSKTQILRRQIAAKEEPSLDLSIKDIGTLERLIMFLRGEPDSRPDSNADMPEDVRKLYDQIKSDPKLVKELAGRAAKKRHGQ